MSIPSFPPLFGESSHGKRKVWKIHVESRGDHGVIVTEHGYENSKIVSNERAIEKGKNLGKANATTALQQAISEAQSTWNKKLDAGYTTGMDVAETPSEEYVVESVGTRHISVLPMLAQDYNKRGKSIVFPCFAQRKLDGVRCVASARGLFSRNGKGFPHLGFIQSEIAALGGEYLLDGELYSDTLTFQEIVGLVKKEKLRAEDLTKLRQIYLCVYDLVDTERTNEERLGILQNLLRRPTAHLRILETEECLSKEDVKTLHARFVADGYEGLMLRNKTAKYRVGVRSTDLQKYKEFEDAEYPVMGFKEGEGLEKGCVIWICRTSKGQEFAVRPRGTHEERATLFSEGAKYVGKFLTVRFQELTTDGIPRFPVGISFRDYE
jgi:ATP-dependent DNA ligase